MMGIASLGGKTFHIDPSLVHWDFAMKVVDTKTVGGKVIQVLGTTLGDMIVTGSFAPVRRRGQTAAWEAEEEFMEQVKDWARETEGETNPAPLRFTYPPRGWDFHVFIKNVSPTRQANEEFAPKYTLTLFIVEDRTRVVVKGIKDLYIQRLFDGVGWKQTKYNGPSQAEVDSILQGRSIGDYLRDEFNQAAAGQTDNPLPTGSDVNANE